MARALYLVCLVTLLNLAALSALAQQCEKVSLTAEVLRSWSNPKPDPADVLVPLPGGTELALVDVPLSGSGLYLDEKAVFRMGSVETHPFETPLDVRIGSPLIDENGRARLLVGKYELSKGQFVMITGRGSVQRGIAALAERSRDERTARLLNDYLTENGTCEGVLTDEIVRYLSEPLSFFSYTDFAMAIDDLNLYCLSRAECRKHLTNLGTNPDFPGFFRLPTEHEWEYLARGGRELVDGKLKRVDFQADIPFIEPGLTMSTVAHIGSDPQFLLPIGSRDPWFGFHDMIGSVQELMQNPFTAENGFGAVGGYVARGGSFRTPVEDVRVSSRTELSPFLVNENTGRIEVNYFPNTGIRLALGLPIVGRLQRTGDALSGLTADYVLVAEAGDIAGNTESEGRLLDPLGSDVIRLADEVGKEDPEDYFFVTLRDYALLSLSLESETTISVSFTDENGKLVLAGELQGGAPKELTSAAPLMPGRYVMRFSDPQTAALGNSYIAFLSRTLAKDTGVENADATMLAVADSISTKSTVYTGFVGTGDRIDVFPVANSSSIGGLLARVSKVESPVTLSFLNERQDVLATGTVDAGGSLDVPVALAPQKAAFVMVAAEDGKSTLYEIEIKSALPFDPAMATDIAKLSRPGLPRRNYTGLLSEASPQLYLGVDIKTARQVRVELDGIDADVDIDILNSAGIAQVTGHNRPGTAAEFLSATLEAGSYVLRVQLRDQSRSSQFTLIYDTMELPIGNATNDLAAARAIPEVLPRISSDPIFRSGLTRGEVKYYSFTLNTEMRVQAIISDFTASADLDLFLESESGEVLAKSGKSGAERELIAVILPVGSYYLRVQPTGTTGTNFVMLIDGFGLATQPDLTDFGNFVEQHEDWRIFQDGESCSMVSIGRISPEFGWLRHYPVFHIRVTRNRDTITIYMMEGAQNLQVEPMGGVVTRPSGRRAQLPTVWDDDLLKPLTLKEGKQFIDTAHTSLFRTGAQLEIFGKTPEGQDAFVNYSLEGYTKAASAINRICGADAEWLLGE